MLRVGKVVNEFFDQLAVGVGEFDGAELGGLHPSKFIRGQKLRLSRIVGAEERVQGDLPIGVGMVDGSEGHHGLNPDGKFFKKFASDAVFQRFTGLLFTSGEFP